MNSTGVTEIDRLEDLGEDTEELRRQYLLRRLIDRWLSSGRYDQLNLVAGEHQNPEYRIADDVRIAADAPVDFVSGITSAFLSAATFIVVLWTIGGALEFDAAGMHFYIPGFLVIAAVAYAIIASGSMLLIGRRFVTVSEQKNQSEAEFRYLRTRLRENGEASHSFRVRRRSARASARH